MKISMRSLSKIFILLLASAGLISYQNCGKLGSIKLKEGTSLSSMSAPPVLTAPIDGKVVFAQNCSTCHTQENKADRTAMQITAAIGTVPQMTGLKNILTIDQINAVAVYLKITNPMPVACSTNFAPVRTPVRMLSNAEYDNIAQDVLLSKKKVSVEAIFLPKSFGDSGFSNAGMSALGGSRAISSLMIERYWNAANILATEVIASKGVAGGAYSLIASCAVNVPTVADTCYDTVIRNLGLKIWRRPLSEVATNNEFARLKNIFKADANFDIGLSNVIKSLLISPNFLFVSYGANSILPAGQPFDLNPYQLASRLSFFLWHSAPDDTLLNAAKTGELMNATSLQAQVLRMLKDPRAKRISATLAQEWIGVNDDLSLQSTGLDANLIKSMISETQFMLEDIVISDSSFNNVISADYSFLNKPLADYYGVSFQGADSTKYYKTNLASTKRRGVFSQGGFLVATSEASLNVTHPMTRGRIISTKVACVEIGDPPADAAATQITGLPPDPTPAEKFGAIAKISSCTGCHSTLNPYGLPLEVFDAKGAFRTAYLTGRPVDSSGRFTSGESFTDVSGYHLAMAENTNVKACMARTLMAVGLTRKVNSIDDKCVGEKIGLNSVNKNSKFSDLILEIVNSRQFRIQTAEAQ